VLGTVNIIAVLAWLMKACKSIYRPGIGHILKYILKYFISNKERNVNTKKLRGL
jgi:uncharacterized membrane protein